MPSILERRSKDGSKAFTVQIRLKGVDPVTRTFTDLKAAKAWGREQEALLKEQRKRGGVRSDVGTLTVGKLLLEFLADPETKRLRYFDDLHRICAWWTQEYGGERALDLNVLKLRAARDELSKGRQPATVNRYLSGMRSAWNWARSAGLIPRDYLWPERLMLTEPKGRVRFLSDAELAKLLAAAKAHSAEMSAAVIVSIATGLRRGELLRLDWSDVDSTRQTIGIRITKTDKPRTVHLPKSAVDALQALRAGKILSLGPVFISADGTRLRKSTLETRWKTVRSRAGFGDFRWHDLRHSCASFLAQQGATLMQIGVQLGHTSPAVTMRYAHLVEGAALPAHAKLDEKLRG